LIIVGSGPFALDQTIAKRPSAVSSDSRIRRDSAVTPARKIVESDPIGSRRKAS
jgi:hypothetical protein